MLGHIDRHSCAVIGRIRHSVFVGLQEKVPSAQTLYWSSGIRDTVWAEVLAASQYGKSFGRDQAS